MQDKTLLVVEVLAGARARADWAGDDGVELG